MPLANSAALTEQMSKQRRAVDFDTFDTQLQELVAQVGRKEISIAPAYQRQFRWDDARCSQLIESLILGIPVPNLFMATNPDNTWEVVDGLQRMCSVIKFLGDDELRGRLGLGSVLVLKELQKLDKFNGATFEALPSHIQQHIRTRPLRVVTLNDKSDAVVRFDLFERLNTGGIALSNQEIRNCVFRGKFADKLEELSNKDDFKTIAKLTDKQRKDGTAEECVLRYFAFLERYRKFDHSVKMFLNGYMKDASKKFEFEKREPEFLRVIAELAKAFPKGITRPHRPNTTPLNLFEGVAVGAALAMRKGGKLETSEIRRWIDSKKLRKFTTAATNDRPSVRGRIEFCRDRFLGKADVQSAAD